ncbi:Lactose operon repressor [compost metagenome]
MIRGLHDIGLSVPADLSIVGFDDIFYSQYMIPSLTTIRQDIVAKGQIAVKMLLDQINGTALSTDKKSVKIPVSLAVRQSSTTYKGI